MIERHKERFCLTLFGRREFFPGLDPLGKIGNAPIHGHG